MTKKIDFFDNTVGLTGISANGTVGTAGQVLKSNGTTTYWDADAASGGDAATLDGYDSTAFARLAATNIFTAFTTINLNPLTLPAPPVGTIFHMGGLTGSPARFLLDGFGAGANFTFRRANGTPSAPTALGVDSNIISMTSFGYDGNVYSSNRGGLVSQTSQNWTETAHGTRLIFSTTANNTIINTNRWLVENDGSFIYSGGSLTGNGSINAVEYFDNGVNINTIYSSLALANIFTQLQTINLNGSALPAPPSTGTTNIHIGALDNNLNRALFDAFGSASSIAFRRASGTNASKIALALNDTIGNITAFGYGATGYSDTLRAAFVFQAAEAWTDAAQGTRISFTTTPNSYTTATARWGIENDGSFIYSGGSLTGNGTINAVEYFDNGTNINTIYSSLTGATFTGNIIVNKSGVTVPTAFGADEIRIVGNTGNDALFWADSFGGPPVFGGRRAEGVPGSPSAVQLGNTLVALRGYGYGESAYSASHRGSVSVIASENWSNTAQGTRIVLATTANTTAGQSARWLVENDGSFIYSGGSLTGNGTVNAINYFDDGTNINTIYSSLALANIFTQLQTINLNGSALPAAISPTSIHIGALDNNLNRALFDSFGTANSIAFRRANNTNASKAALALNDVIGNITAFGYGIGTSSGYSTVTRATIAFAAAEAWTDTAQGTRIAFTTTANTTATGFARWGIENDGSFVYNGGSLTGNGTVNAIDYFDNGTNINTIYGSLATVNTWQLLQTYNAGIKTTASGPATHISIERTGASPSLLTIANLGNQIDFDYNVTGYRFLLSGSPRLVITGASTFTYNGNAIWHAGNDGPSSGLNADLFDDLNVDRFLTVYGTSTTTATFAVGDYIGFNAYYDNVDARWEAKNTQEGWYVFRNSGNNVGLELYVEDGAVTAASAVTTYSSYSWRNGDFFSGGNKFWHAGNMGTGTGLDADLWDNNQFADYLDQAVKTTSTPTFGGITVSKGWTAQHTFFTLTSVFPTSGSRSLTVASPTTDSVSEPFIINTGNSLDFHIDSISRLLINFSGNFIFTPLSAFTVTLAGIPTFTNTTDAANNYGLYVDSDRATFANNDSVSVGMRVSSSSGTQREIATIRALATSIINGSEISRIDFSTIQAGTLAQRMTLNAASLVPYTNDSAALGTTANMWSDLFLASGGVINFNNGDVTVTHSADTLTFAGASSGYSFDAGLTVLNSAAASTFAVGFNGAFDTFAYISSAAGRSRNIIWRTGASQRWVMGTNNVSEGGSNAGSNFSLEAYDDANTLLGSVFTVARSTRVLNFTVAPTFTDASTTRTNLGLGTAATRNTGTSGTTIPLLDGTNTWSNIQTFTQVNLTDTNSNSLTLGAIWAKGSSGAILLDDFAQKRISWNDGAGNLNIRAGHYMNGTEQYVVTGDGAALINFSSDAQAGAITFKTAVTGTAAGTVTWAKTLTLSTTTFTLDGIAIPTISSSDTLSNKTIAAPVLSGQTIANNSSSGVATTPLILRNAFSDINTETVLQFNTSASVDRFAQIASRNNGSNDTGLIFRTGSGGTLTDAISITGPGVVTLSSGAVIPSPTFSGTISGSPTYSGSPLYSSVSNFSPQIVIRNTNQTNNAGYLIIEKVSNNNVLPINSPMGTLMFRAGDTGGVPRNAAYIQATVKSQNTSVVGTSLDILTSVAGVTDTAEGSFFGGLILGAPSGTYKGVGTLNAATNIYVNNVLVPTLTSVSEFTNKTLNGAVFTGTMTGAATWTGTQTFLASGAATTLIIGGAVDFVPALRLTSNAGQDRRVNFFTSNTSGSTIRWSLLVSNAAESGSNAGSNFSIQRFDDAGTFIDQPFAITRNTGAISITTPTTISTTGIGTLLSVTSSNGDATAHGIDIFRNSTTPAVNDVVGELRFLGKDSGTTTIPYGRVYTTIVDPTAGSLDSSMIFDAYANNVSYAPLTLGLTENEHRFTTPTSSIVTSRGTNGYGSFYARGSGTNPAYMFFGNDNATAERARITVNNAGDFIVSTNGGTANNFKVDSSGVITTNGNTIWHAGNDGDGTSLDAGLLSSYNHLKLAYGNRANRSITGGGTITVNSLGSVLWGSRFIVISSGRGTSASTSGYFDINCPTSGSITGVGGAASVTADAAGIPLAAWQALYYILPIGSNNTSLAANFRVVGFTADVDIPHDWVLICLRNGDNDVFYFNNGIQLKVNGVHTAGTVWNSGNDGPASGLNADLLDDYNESSFWRVNTIRQGDYGIARASSSNDVFGGLEIRENALVSNTQSTAIYAPGINFHWGNIAAARIYMNASGQFVLGGQTDITVNRRDLLAANVYSNGNLVWHAGSLSLTAFTARVTLTTGVNGTLTASHANISVELNGNVTLPNSVFTAGDKTVFDPGTSARTFTRGSGIAMYVNGVDVASATLAANQIGGAHWRTASVVILTGAFT